MGKKLSFVVFALSLAFTIVATETDATSAASNTIVATPSATSIPLDDKPSITVMTFAAGDGVARSNAESLRLGLEKELRASGKYDVVPWQDIQDCLTGLSKASLPIPTRIVYGDLERAENSYLLQLRIMDVASRTELYQLRVTYSSVRGLLSMLPSVASSIESATLAAK